VGLVDRIPFWVDNMVQIIHHFRYHFFSNLKNMLAILSSFNARETLILRNICDLAGLHSYYLFLIIVIMRIVSILDPSVP
jgi:hypothetical protein